VAIAEVRRLMETNPEFKERGEEILKMIYAENKP
jgi:hypothetical protein